ncbi:MAG: ABC transporter permease [Gammaproteobacteria bacterium]|nr:ABC transporter permease [Gammaproteobacteria bacterium]
MHTYLLRRLLLMFPTLLGITVVVFAVMAAAPGGISAQSLIEGQSLEPEVKKAMEEYYNRRYGLDQPAPIQYLRWLNNISPIGFTLNADNEFENFGFKGSDLGQSFLYGRDVSDLLAERVPITLLLNVLSIPIIYLVSIVIGVYAATHRGKLFDTGTSVGMMALWSIPTMLAGVLLIGFFASEQYWHWFPTAGLSEREALDMTFLPHWSNWTDILLLFALMAVFVVLFSQLSVRLGQVWRTGLMAILGMGLGYLMGSAIAGDTSFATYLFLMVFVGLISGVIGFTQFTALRTATMGVMGLTLGVVLAFHWMQGEFVRGFLFDRLWHLVLPLLCFTYGGFAFLAKLTRTSVLENLQADYARTALAKGVSERDVLWQHVFRNSLIPLITVSATLLPSLLAGSVIIEAIFSIDGMGKLAVEAVQGRDREMVLSITLISGLLTLVSYIIADIFYALVDPRVSYD